MAYTVRPADVDDLDVICQIWTQGVHASLGVPLQEDVDYRAYFKERLKTQGDVFKYFVVENEAGEVLSWQSLSPFRSNPAVAGKMAELSAYAKPEGPSGTPTLLGLQTVFRFADASPLHYVVAFVAMGNANALRLAARLGMSRVGTLPPTPKAPALPELAYLVYPCQATDRAQKLPTA